MTKTLTDLFQAPLINHGFKLNCFFYPKLNKEKIQVELRALNGDQFDFYLLNGQTFHAGQVLQSYLDYITIDKNFQPDPKAVIDAYHSMGKALGAIKTIYTLTAVTSEGFNGAQSWITFGYQMSDPVKDMPPILNDLRDYLINMGYDKTKIETLCTAQNLQTVQDIQNKVTAVALGGPQVKYQGSTGIREVEPGFSFLRDPDGTFRLKTGQESCYEITWKGQRVI